MRKIGPIEKKNVFQKFFLIDTLRFISKRTHCLLLEGIIAVSIYLIYDKYGQLG